MDWTPRSLVLTCEHAVATIPARYAGLFEGAERILASHRGYDRGALELARVLARRSRTPLIAGRASRLLVDLNRSESHPDCFSSYTKALPPHERERILEAYHRPHRDRVRESIARAARRAPVLHVGVHSFTPVRSGQPRSADVGLLYDPRRDPERALAAAWKRALREARPTLRVRSNYPYRGTADGLTTTLRRELAPEVYLGLELEVSQRFWRRPSALTRDLVRQIAQTLLALCETPRAPLR